MSVIKLNVGGKSMTTFKLTFEAVPLLHRRLNNDLTVPKIGDAYFLDRDPAAFSALLKHLRGYELSPKEHALAAAESSFWSAPLESQVHIIYCSGGELHITPEVWALLPGLDLECATSLKHKRGYPFIELSTVQQDALQALQRALVTQMPMKPLHWHALRQRFYLAKKLPLVQVLPAGMDQYAAEYTICGRPNNSDAAREMSSYRRWTFQFENVAASWYVDLNARTNDYVPCYPDLATTVLRVCNAEKIVYTVGWRAV